jgi:hypothetical protein
VKRNAICRTIQNANLISHCLAAEIGSDTRQATNDEQSRLLKSIKLCFMRPVRRGTPKIDDGSVIVVQRHQKKGELNIRSHLPREYCTSTRVPRTILRNFWLCWSRCLGLDGKSHSFCCSYITICTFAISSKVVHLGRPLLIYSQSVNGSQLMQVACGTHQFLDLYSGTLWVAIQEQPPPSSTLYHSFKSKSPIIPTHTALCTSELQAVATILSRATWLSGTACFLLLTVTANGWTVVQRLAHHRSDGAECHATLFHTFPRNT